MKLWNIVLWLVSVIGGVAAGAFVVLPQAPMYAVAMVVVGLWASFAITAQEPRVSLHEDPVTLRKAIRFCAVVAFVASIMEIFGTSGRVGMILNTCGTILGFARIIAIIGELVYFRRFARRVPDGKLERSTTVLLWGVPITMGVGLLGTLVLNMAAPGAGAATPTGAPSGAGGTQLAVAGAGAILCCAMLAAFVFLIWYIRVLTKYKNAFMQAAAESRAALAATVPDGTAGPPEIP